MKKLFPLFIFSLALIVSACSGGSDQQQQAEETATDTETTMESDARTIEVYGIDQMKYVVKEQSEGLQVGESVEVKGETYYYLNGINAAPGEELTVNLTTISSLPATAMSHNWVLLTQETDAEAFNKAAIKAKANDYVAPEMENQVLQNTGLVGGGETASVTFSAPENTGDYEYICSFPGHFSAGMKGVLSVQ